MQLAHHRRLLRRGAGFVALGVLACVTALTLSQCRMVSENTAGVRVSQLAASSCIKGCNNVYQDSVRIESRLHVSIVQACTSDACKAAEEIRHQNEMNRLDAAKDACQNNCHHQGAGTAGR